jgi:hypothetical protein
LHDGRSEGGYVRDAYIKSLSDKVQYDFSPARGAPVFEDVNALPRAEHHPAGIDGNG